MGKHLDLTKGTNGYSVYANFPVAEMTLEEIKSSPQFGKLGLGHKLAGDDLEIRAWVALSNNVEKLAAFR